MLEDGGTTGFGHPDAPDTIQSRYPFWHAPHRYKPRSTTDDLSNPATPIIQASLKAAPSFDLADELLCQEGLESMDPTLLLPGAVYPSTKMVSVRYDDNGVGPDLKMREVK